MAASIGAIVIGLLLDVDRSDWLWLVLAIGMVWFAEAINTALERLADAITVEHDPQIKVAKDCAAGAVLIASIIALLIGLLIFVPLLCQRFQ